MNLRMKAPPGHHWFRNPYGRDRRILYRDDGTQTPYFVDRCESWSSHAWELYGSGMDPSGCAARLNWFHSLSEAAEAVRRMIETPVVTV